MDDEPAADEATTNEEKEKVEKKRLEELREKVLFYLTTFFILLGIFSLFVGFLLIFFLPHIHASTSDMIKSK
jgi:cell division septal protein FtsQ